LPVSFNSVGVAVVTVAAMSYMAAIVLARPEIYGGAGLLIKKSAIASGLASVHRPA
jgi:hypothetical protein